MSKSSDKINRNWFNNTEFLLLGSSIGSSVAAIIFQQVTFAAITSIPLSLAISLNSRNRRRLEEVEQQHKASITHLEQKFSDKQECTNKVLYSLPTRFELLEIEKSLENYNTTFTNQLNNLEKRQTSVGLELQQIDNDRKKITELQQQLYVLESILESHNSTHLNTELKETLVAVEGKVKKLERQFNNLPLSSLQHQLTQVQQIVDKLQISSTESTQLDKCLLGEIQHISQQIQSINSRTQELSLAHTEIRNQVNLLKPTDTEKIRDEIKSSLFNDFQTNIIKSTEINQHFIEKVQLLHQQVQAVSSNVSERIKTLQVELQSQRLSGEKSERKIHEDLYELVDWYKNLENELKQLVNNNDLTTNNKVEQCEIKVTPKKETQYLCDHCHQPCKTQPIEGGFLFNNKFCLPSCKDQFERLNGLLY